MRTKVTGGELGGLTNLAVLAPVKTGFIDGLETMTYVERLHRLLDALNEARQNLREATLVDPPFPDALGRFGILRNFRYVVVPPDSPLGADGLPGRYRLSLNVTFDGGWEPYMRVIYRDIGFLLDALFCHCDGYPGSTTSTFDAYCRWVRDNEQMAGLFFADSSVTSADQQYLETLERLQRETADPAAADRLIAGHALQPIEQQIREGRQKAVAQPQAALVTSLRALKGLHRLSPLFASQAERRILLRFTHEVLQDFKAILPDLQKLPTWPAIALGAKDELAWFQQVESPPDARPAPPRFTPTEVQAGIVGDRGSATHGALVLLRVQDANKAIAWLERAPVSRHGGRDADGIRRNVAFTYAGLRALGFSARQLDALPQEFIDGMESRAGLLGDVRGNHPDFWPRPERCDENGASDPNDRVDPATAHVALMLRLADERPGAPASSALHPTLRDAIALLKPASTGLRVVAVQPTRSWREGSNNREHFGFLDGFSQPGLQAVEPAPLPRDTVPPGDLFLGHANSFGDAPDAQHPVPALLNNGSFLVVRKLRQHLDHLGAALDAHLAGAGLGEAEAKAKKKAILEKMMGRGQDGTPLVAPAAGRSGNDFDYDRDTEGRQCPFHSHVRRANPRDGRQAMPRIVRAGMSYGDRVEDGADPKADRGILFMAYCASIAEQFETIQRWIAGGNSSGVSSAQADPLLAVPRPGDRRTFRCLAAPDSDEVLRVDLGDKPFVSLQWGLYLFVPSMHALRHLHALRQLDAPPHHPPHPAQPPAGAPTPAPADPLDAWRQRLEDPDPVRSVSTSTWEQVRRQGGFQDARPYGRLVGRQADVLRVLQDKGQNYSVQGYGHRMAASLGHNYLGMDAHTGHAVQAPVVNAAIEAISEKAAFEATAAIVDQILKKAMALAIPNPDGSARAPVDLVALGERVLAALCTLWIGLPEAPAAAPNPTPPLMVVGGRVPGNPQPPRCPGNFLTASHYIFTPHPTPDTAEAGRVQGRAVLQAVQALLARGTPALGPLAQAIRQGLQDVEGIHPNDLPDVIANSISGVLLGFPPTVYGNYLRTMETWTREKSLWEHQRSLADLKASGLERYECARRALRPAMMQTMRQRPVPEQLWRCPVHHGRVVGARDGEPGEEQRVVLGIASALTDPAAPDEMMFGGSRDPHSRVATDHACPGYGMGTGVMLGLIAGLLEAGTLRPTGSPVLLMLTQQPRPPAPAAA
ncbi:MAG: Dyp-type peroxidase [Variovorax sp.]|nr:Dyp-type peroxidase [Variovorax sp.]